MNKIKKKGFSYHVPFEKINEYRKWPIERRLEWLYQANQLRNLLPDEIIEIQEQFRKGER